MQISNDCFMNKHFLLIALLVVLVSCKNNLKTEYYADGKIKSEETLKDGKPDGYYISYYENGKIKDSGSIVGGKLNGFCKSYYENGKENWEGIFKDGKEDGYYKKYYESGNLRADAFFKNGIPDSVNKEYTEDGKIKIRSEWKNGNLATVDYYDSQGINRKRIYYSKGQQTGQVNFDEDGTPLLPSHAIIGSKKGDTIKLGETYNASIFFIEHNLNSLTNRHVFIAQLDSNDNPIGESKELPLVKNEYAVYTDKPQAPGKYDFSGYLEYTKANGHIVKAPFRWSFYAKPK
jgi:antitoxin component YwqK of YwqJK toxin-antitoxin module